MEEAKKWLVLGNNGISVEFETWVGARIFRDLKQKKAKDEDEPVKYKIIDLQVANKGRRK